MTLDELLGSAEPHATFHDASLIDLHVDYSSGTLLARFDVCVGPPDGQSTIDHERRRQGRIELQGLHFWAIEPLAEPTSGSCAPLWLTADGPLAEAPTDSGRCLATAVPAGAVAWYLYFSDLNAFASCAAREASFRWL
jgi:hypothetical protein